MSEIELVDRLIEGLWKSGWGPLNSKDGLMILNAIRSIPAEWLAEMYEDDKDFNYTKLQWRSLSKEKA